MWSGWVQGNFGGQLVPMVRLVPIENDVKRSLLVAMGLLELPDLRNTLVDIGTTLLCIIGYNGLPGRTLPINLIHETVRQSERVDNAALSSAVSYEIPGQMTERALFCTFSR